MPAHSRPKDGVAALAYVAGIHALAPSKAWMAGTSPAMTNIESVQLDTAITPNAEGGPACANPPSLLVLSSA